MVKLKGQFFALGAAISWTIAPILTKEFVLESPSPIFTSFVSTALGAAVYFMLLSVTDRSKLKLNLKRESATIFFIFSGVLSSLAILCNVAALSLAPVSVVVPLTSTSPLFTVTFSLIFLRGYERITPRVLLATALIFVGSILITQ
jgi:uncharacterized membrane protein